MQLTNRFNLPPEVVAALTKNRYQADDEDQDLKTDFSASTLIAPVQQTILRKRHPERNAADVIDLVWVLFGHIAHALLEEHGSDGSIVEKRFYMTVLGKIISGQVDHYKDRCNTDYKTVGAYKIVKQDFDDWTKQQNIYATLEEEAGLEVNQLRVIALIKDWSEQDSGKPNYPEAPIIVVPLLKWSKQARMRYIEGRVKLLIENETLPDDKLLPCTDKERWMDFRDWYVLKNGNKVGRCFETEALADEFCKKVDGPFTKTRRTTAPKRCLKYCNVSKMCFQMKQYLSEQK